MSDVPPPSSEALTVTLTLPPDLVAIVRDQARRSGRSATQVIQEALRQGLAPAPAWQAVIAQLTVLEPLVGKVADLEAKIDRLLDARSFSPIAASERPASEHPASERPSLTANASPSATHAIATHTIAPDTIAPDTSAPDTIATQTIAPERCPRCDRPLGAPLKSSGRQVCGKCGWTNQPRRPPPTLELPTDDLQKILTQAASESLENMKPRRSPD